jgi:hypothetical protein
MRKLVVAALHLAMTLPVLAAGPATPGRVITLAIDSNEISEIHLKPQFESIIHMPEEVTSVVLGSPGEFKAEHSEGEPTYVYVKPIKSTPSQSNLLISTRSGQHVALELINDGADAAAVPVDFLIEYKTAGAFLLSRANGTAAPSSQPPIRDSAGSALPTNAAKTAMPPSGAPPSALELEYQMQQRINTPAWTKWDGRQIETSIGDVRQFDNQVVVSYSIFNPTNEALEIVPPQIQISGVVVKKKKKKKEKGKDIIADQLEIRDYRLSTTRLEAGARADGVVLFDRPNYKQSTEKLLLQLAQADRVDQPVLIKLPFTPPIAGDVR